MPQTSTPRFTPDDEVAGRYRVLRPLGRGGMGEVYLARDQHLDRPVVLKCMLTGQQDLAQRFQQEMQLTARLRHPNIVTVYDHSREGDQLPFLVMELIEGPSLRRVMATHSPLSVPTALTITRQVLSGLAAAHQVGIIHRDLKPANIMIARSPGDVELVKVLDFGVAKAVMGESETSVATDESAPATTLGTVLGTPRYMSPEQIAGDELDGRSDIYSLGCILYEMLAGVPAVQADTERKTFAAHLAHDIIPLDERCSGLPPGVAETVSHALALEPVDRFQNADEMRTAIDALLDAPVPLDFDTDVVPVEMLAAETAVSWDGDPGPDTPEVSTPEPPLDEVGTSAEPQNVIPETAVAQRTQDGRKWLYLGVSLAAVIGIAVWGLTTRWPGASADFDSRAGSNTSDLERESPGDNPDPSGTRQAQHGAETTTAPPVMLSGAHPDTTTQKLSGASGKSVVTGSAGGYERESCPVDGQVRLTTGPDACCWPGQQWSKDGCQGRPSSCPDGSLAGDFSCLAVPTADWHEADMCRKGAATICYQLGKAALDSNFPLGIAYYHQACKAGDANVCFYLGNLQIERNSAGDTQRAFLSWNRACDLGKLQACNELVNSFNGGYYGFEDDPGLATRYAEILCRSEWQDRCGLAGENYLTGNGVDQNEALATEYLTIACEKNNKNACALLEAHRR